MGDPEPRITDLLEHWEVGQSMALQELMPLVADELRHLARHHLRREQAGHTLQPTALVNELYLRLVRQRRIRLENRTQFFAFASRLMRRILVDYHRSRRAAKRGSGERKITLDEEIAPSRRNEVDLLELDDALQSLRQLDARQHQIVELRFFGGLKVPEVAQLLDISPATVKRDWAAAKAWLTYQMRHD